MLIFLSIYIYVYTYTYYTDTRHVHTHTLTHACTHACMCARMCTRGRASTSDAMPCERDVHLDCDCDRWGCVNVMHAVRRCCRFCCCVCVVCLKKKKLHKHKLFVIFWGRQPPQTMTNSFYVYGIFFFLSAKPTSNPCSVAAAAGAV